jgi:hypothetical protein
MAEAPIRFHRLSFVPEQENEVLVGRPDSESFAVFDVNDAALLQRMAEGTPPDEAADWYQATYGQAVDMPDLLRTLTDLGFTRGEDEPDTAARAVGLQWLGRVVFSKPAFGVLVVITASWIAVICTHPYLAPRPGQVFFTSSILLVQLAVLLLQIPWIALHEGAHVLAGRRLGLPSRLGVSTRLYFIVFETRMNGLLTVPRRKRYVPILAGIAVDIFVISTLGLIAFLLAGPGGAEPFVGRILLAMAFPILVRLGYQFLLFLQTDIYFAVMTALGCHDLHAAARTVIWNRIWRFLRRPGRLADEDQWTENDLRMARWYAPSFAVGAMVLIVIGVVVVIPILTRVLHLLIQSVSLGPGNSRFWDGALFAALNLTQFFLLGFFAIRNWIRARRLTAQTA